MMGNNHIANLLNFCQKLYNELDSINTVIVITHNYFLNKEISGQYYNSSRDISLNISDERNKCINMLTLISEKLSITKGLCESIEDEVVSHNDTHNCG